MQVTLEDTKFTIPKTYFDLIDKVGSKGPYQRNLFILFFFNWYIAGLILMGTSFLFLNPQFDCSKIGVQTNNCQQYVCSNYPNQQQRIQLLQPKQVQSLATQWGSYTCNQNIQLAVFKMMTYVGAFFGYTVLLSIVDNIGRKKSMVILWSITTFGVILISCSWNIYVATVGLFFAGAGCQCCIRVSMSIMAQVVDYYLRQKYSIALQIGFGLAGVSIGVLYWLIRDWRIIQISFCAAPAILLLIIICYYVEQTPKFLLRKPKHKILKALNRIGKINKGLQEIINQQDIDNVIQQQGEKHQIKTKAMTPIDLCRYKSLRLTTLLFNLLFFFITFVYLGPIVIVDKLGFNDFLSQILLSLSQLIAYPIAFIFIQKTGRRRIGQVMFGLSAIFTGVLIFVRSPSQCNFCPQGIVQIVFSFASRFCISYYFSILFVFITQAYPLRIRGIGFGIASASGAIASSSSQIILNLFQEYGINPMILFTVFAFLAVICLQFTQQTHNKPLKDEIDEIQILKQQIVLKQRQNQTQKDQSQSVNQQNCQQNKRNSQIKNQENQLKVPNSLEIQ